MLAPPFNTRFLSCRAKAGAYDEEMRKLKEDNELRSTLTLKSIDKWEVVGDAGCQLRHTIDHFSGLGELVPKGSVVTVKEIKEGRAFIVGPNTTPGWGSTFSSLGYQILKPSVQHSAAKAATLSSVRGAKNMQMLVFRQTIQNLEKKLKDAKEHENALDDELRRMHVANKNWTGKESKTKLQNRLEKLRAPDMELDMGAITSSPISSWFGGAVKDQVQLGVGDSDQVSRIASERNERAIHERVALSFPVVPPLSSVHTVLLRQIFGTIKTQAMTDYIDFLEQEAGEGEGGHTRSEAAEGILTETKVTALGVEIDELQQQLNDAQYENGELQELLKQPMADREAQAKSANELTRLKESLKEEEEAAERLANRLQDKIQAHGKSEAAWELRLEQQKAIAKNMDTRIKGLEKGSEGQEPSGDHAARIKELEKQLAESKEAAEEGTRKRAETDNSYVRERITPLLPHDTPASLLALAPHLLTHSHSRRSELLKQLNMGAQMEELEAKFEKMKVLNTKLVEEKNNRLVADQKLVEVKEVKLKMDMDREAKTKAAMDKLEQERGRLAEECARLEQENMGEKETVAREADVRDKLKTALEKISEWEQWHAELEGESEEEDESEELSGLMSSDGSDEEGGKLSDVD